MRDDIEYVGRRLYDMEFPWGIVTNGMKLDENRLESLRKAGIHNITISLDGTENAHNWMRNHPSSFDNACTAIKMTAGAADLNFEAAAELRDKMIELKKNLRDM